MTQHLVRLRDKLFLQYHHSNEMLISRDLLQSFNTIYDHLILYSQGCYQIQLFFFKWPAKGQKIFFVLCMRVKIISLAKFGKHEPLKFMFSKKTTNFDEISQLIWILLSKFQISLEFLSKEPFLENLKCNRLIILLENWLHVAFSKLCTLSLCSLLMT